MESKSNQSSQSYDIKLLPPVHLRLEEDDLCKKLDEFYKFYNLNIQPSNYYRGAIFAAREENRSNPDRVAQAAHSLREILYPFFSPQIKKVKDKKRKAFKKFGSVGIELITDDYIGRFYGKLERVAHHDTEENFEDLRQEFVTIIRKALSRQVDIHSLVDEILKRNIINDKHLAEEIKDIISVNQDTHQYFFTQVGEKWLDWLWENGFLDIIKEKAEDSSQYRYRIPELNYLARISKKVPAKVVDIILAVQVSTETFNPEVVDRFLWICSILPAEQLAKIVPKIRKDGWIQLMDSFRQWGFEYEKMFQVLADARNYKSILILSEAILAVRTKEEIEKSTNRITTDNPFYFSDLSYTKVFEHLVLVDGKHAEQALELSVKTMTEVVLLNGKTQSNEIFPIEDTFSLLDVDFFDLELGQKERLSHRDDVRELAAVVKVLIERLIGKKCAEADAVQRIYKQYIKSLPKNRAMWRLRLFVLSLCPEIFKAKLKNAFFRLFKVKHYHEIMSGAEYEKALKKGFSVLSDSDKREYIKRVIEYFTKKDREKKNEKENWHLKYGSRILSVITAYLTEEEKQGAEEVGFELDPKYKPEPSIGRMRGGMVVPRGPITQEEFGNLPITKIAKKLRNEWAPEKLSEQNKGDDFLNPLNAEGTDELLRADIPKRLQDYMNNANLFFEKSALDQHYTYSFLRGIQKVLRGGKIDINDMNWDNLIALCIAIKDSGEAESFDSEKREHNSSDAWLAGWTEVHSAMTDVIQGLLNEKSGSISVDFSKYRDQLFETIDYLLRYPDPTPKDEKIETAKSKTKSPGDSDYLVTDPFTMAINTVRGRAFQAFVLFMYQDGKKLTKEDDLKISTDVKGLYEAVLKNEDTRALMFMFGHYLPSFYFRDKEWIRKLLPQIFPGDPEKRYLSTAAWEGYLANDLYEELFFDTNIQKLYEQSLSLTETEYPEQKHFREPDEGIATHLALAFVHYKEFGFEHPLFKAFWANNNPTRHAEFVSFIGGSFVSGDNAKLNDFLKKEPRSKERLRDFWDWILKNYGNKEPFVEFGFWISLEKDIFELIWLAKHVKQTLEKTNGALDYEYGLIKYIVQFAEKAPEDTLAIARLYLFKGGAREIDHRISFHIDKEWFEAFKILYNNSSTKSGTYTLIDDLIREGGSVFWGLKKILDERNPA